MKKKLALLAAAAAILTLTACGKKDAPPPTAPEESIPIMLVESKPTEVPTEATEAPTVSPVKPTEATKPTEKPDTKPGEKPAEKPEKPTEKPDKKPEKPTEKPKPQATKPTVTKSPTKETVKEGEKAWFVARADGADSIDWWFSPADGSAAKSAEETVKALPGLKLGGTHSESLALENIPAAMNGWSVKAEFSNKYGSTYSKPAEIFVEAEPEETTAPEKDPSTSKDPMIQYSPVLANVLYLQTVDPEKVTEEEMKKQDTYELFASRELMDGLMGYVLLDVDGDGTKEMVIGRGDKSDFGEHGGEIVVAMFTLKDGKPVKLLQSHARDRYYLGRDNLIVNEGSSGAANSVQNYFVLKDGKLELKESLWSNGTDDDGNPNLFYNMAGNTEETDDNRVTREEYDELSQKMSAKRLPLPPLTAVS